MDKERELVTDSKALTREPNVFWAVRNTHEGVDTYFVDTDDGWAWVTAAKYAAQHTTREAAEERMEMLVSRYTAHQYAVVCVTAPSPAPQSLEAGENVALVLAVADEIESIPDNYSGVGLSTEIHYNGLAAKLRSLASRLSKGDL